MDSPGAVEELRHQSQFIYTKVLCQGKPGQARRPAQVSPKSRALDCVEEL